MFVTVHRSRLSSDDASDSLMGQVYWRHCIPNSPVTVHVWCHCARLRLSYSSENLAVAPTCDRGEMRDKGSTLVPGQMSSIPATSILSTDNITPLLTRSHFAWLYHTSWSLSPTSNHTTIRAINPKLFKKREISNIKWRMSTGRVTRKPVKENDDWWKDKIAIYTASNLNHA